MKIGVIIPLYNAKDLISRCLEAWKVIKDEGQYTVKIFCIDGRFNEYGEETSPPNSTDGTVDLLKAYKESKIIDDYILAGGGLLEHDIRNLGLNQCKASDCDILWNVDSDEFYTPLDIRQIIKYIEKKTLVAYFKIHFKNLVFNSNTWVDGFCPPRIWRVKHGNLTLNRFHWDNDCYYRENGSVYDIGDKLLGHLAIPKSVAFITHETWLSNERSKLKCLYQEKHFAHGAGCGFKWDEEKNRLVFNLDYYKKTGQSLPELHTDEQI